MSIFSLNVSIIGNVQKSVKKTMQHNFPKESIPLILTGMLCFKPLSMMFFLRKNAMKGTGTDNRFSERTKQTDVSLKYPGPAGKPRN
jgi:hypothetical protein